MNFSIGFVYPATMTMKSSLWSSIALRMVSIASCPKLSSFCERAYASSMKRTPPRADLITSWVFKAVCPTYPATRPERSTSTSCPFDSTPMFLYILARMRATVVLPVPGLPVKTRCMETGTDFSPFSFLIMASFAKSAISRTSCFIAVSPTSLSSCSMGSSSGSDGVAAAAGEASCAPPS